ncbi:MAG: hypothetical protein HY907_02715 [Deltaproteobacteria bacterium]|nr:hypothetical protein [Deltaproteobacteria bacterium]
MRQLAPGMLLALLVGCATAETLPGDGAEEGRVLDASDADAGDDQFAGADETAGDTDSPDDTDTTADVDAADDGRDDAPVDDGAGDADAETEVAADVRDEGADRADADAEAEAEARDDGRTDDGVADADADAADAGSLDPELSLPDPSGTPCSTPSSMGECPGIEVCRFYTPSEGRCESCSPCGNLGDGCSASSECDILFMCYRGRCTNFCLLGTYMCGAITDCVDIGHPTWGVCLP